METVSIVVGRAWLDSPHWVASMKEKCERIAAATGMHVSVFDKTTMQHVMGCVPHMPAKAA